MITPLAEQAGALTGGTKQAGAGIKSALGIQRPVGTSGANTTPLKSTNMQPWSMPQPSGYTGLQQNVGRADANNAAVQEQRYQQTVAKNQAAQQTIDDAKIYSDTNNQVANARDFYNASQGPAFALLEQQKLDRDFAAGAGDLQYNSDIKYAGDKYGTDRALNDSQAGRNQMDLKNNAALLAYLEAQGPLIDRTHADTTSGIAQTHDVGVRSAFDDQSSRGTLGSSGTDTQHRDLNKAQDTAMSVAQRNKDSSWLDLNYKKQDAKNQKDMMGSLAADYGIQGDQLELAYKKAVEDKGLDYASFKQQIASGYASDDPNKQAIVAVINQQIMENASKFSTLRQTLPGAASTSKIVRS